MVAQHETLLSRETEIENLKLSELLRGRYFLSHIRRGGTQISVHSASALHLLVPHTTIPVLAK